MFSSVPLHMAILNSNTEMSLDISLTFRDAEGNVGTSSPHVLRLLLDDKVTHIAVYDIVRCFLEQCSHGTVLLGRQVCNAVLRTPIIEVYRLIKDASGVPCSLQEQGLGYGEQLDRTTPLCLVLPASSLSGQLAQLAFHPQLGYLIWPYLEPKMIYGTCRFINSDADTLIQEFIKEAVYEYIYKGMDYCQLRFVRPFSKAFLGPQRQQFTEEFRDRVISKLTKAAVASEASSFKRATLANMWMCVGNLVPNQECPIPLPFARGDCDFLEEEITHRLDDGQVVTYCSARGCYLRAIAASKEVSRVYRNLALDNLERENDAFKLYVPALDKSMNAFDLIVQTLEIDFESDIWCTLGNMLSRGSISCATVRGKQYTSLQAYFQGLSHSRASSRSLIWYNLSAVAQDVGHEFTFEGKQYSEMYCLARSAEEDRGQVDAWRFLGIRMHEGEIESTLVNGKSFTVEDLLCYVLARDTSPDRTYEYGLLAERLERKAAALSLGSSIPCVTIGKHKYHANELRLREKALKHGIRAGCGSHCRVGSDIYCTANPDEIHVLSPDVL